jgi:hypothetical protein
MAIQPSTLPAIPSGQNPFLALFGQPQLTEMVRGRLNFRLRGTVLNRSFSLRISDYQEWLSADDLRSCGITAPQSVLDLLSRIPDIALVSSTGYLILFNERGLTDGRIDIDPEDLDGIAILAAGAILAAKDCLTQRQAYRCVYRTLKQYFLGRMALVDVSLATEAFVENKVEGQQWVSRGVYEHAVSGPMQVLVFIENWGVNLLLRSLTGEQRHKLIKAARNGSPSLDMLHEVVYWGVYDSINQGERYFKSIDDVRQLDRPTLADLGGSVMSLSLGQSESLTRYNHRGETDWRNGHSPSIRSWLRGVRYSASDQEIMADRERIAALWLHEHRDDWDGDVRESVYGLAGKSLKNEFITYQQHGTLEGDPKPNLPPVLTEDRSLEYLASREQLPARSKRRPDGADYEGDPSNAHYGNDEIELMSIDAELDADSNRIEIETSRYGRNYYDSWAVAPAASTKGNDFQAWIDLAQDVRSALRAVRLGISEPVIERPPLRPPMAGVPYQPMVKRVSMRTEDLIERDTEAITERILGVPKSEMTRAEWGATERYYSQVLDWLKKKGGYSDTPQIPTWSGRMNRMLSASRRKRIDEVERASAIAAVEHNPNDPWDWWRHTAAYRAVPYVSWAESRETFRTGDCHEPRGVVRSRPRWCDWWGVAFDGHYGPDPVYPAKANLREEPRRHSLKWKLPPLDDPNEGPRVQLPARRTKRSDKPKRLVTKWKKWAEGELVRLQRCTVCQRCGPLDRPASLVRFTVDGTRVSKEGRDGWLYGTWPLELVMPAGSHYLHAPNATVVEETKGGVTTVCRLGKAKGCSTDPEKPEPAVFRPDPFPWRTFAHYPLNPRFTVVSANGAKPLPVAEPANGCFLHDLVELMDGNPRILRTSTDQGALYRERDELQHSALEQQLTLTQRRYGVRPAGIWRSGVDHGCTPAATDIVLGQSRGTRLRTSRSATEPTDPCRPQTIAIFFAVRIGDIGAYRSTRTILNRVLAGQSNFRLWPKPVGWPLYGLRTQGGLYEQCSNSPHY